MSETDKDTIEINFGRHFGKMRKNPWIASTFIFGLLLLGVLVFGVGGSSGVGNEDVVSAEEASGKVLAFLQSNPELTGQVTLVGVEEEGQFYRVTVNFQGQNVPVFATRDGGFLVSNPVALDQVNAPVDSGSGHDAGAGTVQSGTASQASADDDAFIGDANAPVTIVEYSDYQCPFCQRFWAQTLPELKEKYIDTGQVKLVYRDYPLPSHSLADEAAEAAECVRAQSDDATYFEYHDQLFAKQPQITEENLILWAQELGYDISTCLENGEFTSEVQKDFVDGGSLGTPTFFINGQKLEGAVPFSEFERLIEAELAKV